MANDLKFYSLWDDPLCVVFPPPPPPPHPLAAQPSVTLPQLFQYPLIIETPAGCRTLGLAFSKTASSVVSQTLLEYLQKKL